MYQHRFLCVLLGSGPRCWVFATAFLQHDNHERDARAPSCTTSPLAEGPMTTESSSHWLVVIGQISSQEFGTYCQDNAQAIGGFFDTLASAHRKRKAFFKTIVWLVWRMFLCSSCAVSSRLRNSENFWMGRRPQDDVAFVQHCIQLLFALFRALQSLGSTKETSDGGGCHQDGCEGT